MYSYLTTLRVVPQLGSTLFLTLHEVLSCPVPGRVIYSRNLDFCCGDVSNSGGKLRGLVNLIFLIHLVITQGDNSDKTRKFIKCRLKLKAVVSTPMETAAVPFRRKAAT